MILSQDVVRHSDPKHVGTQYQRRSAYILQTNYNPLDCLSSTIERRVVGYYARPSGAPLASGAGRDSGITECVPTRRLTEKKNFLHWLCRGEGSPEGCWDVD